MCGSNKNIVWAYKLEVSEKCFESEYFDYLKILDLIIHKGFERV
jgi:hypothetical protein